MYNYNYYTAIIIIYARLWLSTPRYLKGMATVNPYSRGTPIREEQKKKIYHVHQCRETISPKWKQLPNSIQIRHTLSNCKECAIHHTTLQNAFPGKKLALSKDVATTVKTVINANDETHATREILANLQPLFESRYGHSFTDAVTRLPGSQLQAKPNSVDKRREIQRECKQEIETHYTDVCLSSMQSYKRLRLSRSKRARVAHRRRKNIHPHSKMRRS